MNLLCSFGLHNYEIKKSIIVTISGIMFCKYHYNNDGVLYFYQCRHCGKEKAKLITHNSVKSINILYAKKILEKI